MIAYADAAALERTRTSGRATFFSRSRKAPWVKGETSGNFVDVREVRFDGARTPAPGVLRAIEACSFVVIGPSNPYVSIDPILCLDGVRDAIARKPVIAVSPIVRGAAVKGPLAAMIGDLRGEAPSAGAVARHYGGLLRAMVVERGDERTVTSLSVPSMRVLGASTVMRSRDDRLRLAHEVLAFAAEAAR